MLQDIRRNRLAPTTVWIISLGWLAGTALAGESAESSQDRPAAQPDWARIAESTPRAGVGEWQVMVTELARSEKRTREAEQEVAAARALLRKARQRRYPRGNALAELREKADRNEAKRDAAELSFLEQVTLARRAGVPAGLLSDFLDRAEQIESLRDGRTTVPRAAASAN